MPGVILRALRTISPTSVGRLLAPGCGWPCVAVLGRAHETAILVAVLVR